jgi:hypothetical protein
VFEDRVGLLVVNPDRGVSRLPAIAAYAGGLIRDVFLPRDATPAHFAAVRAAGLSAHLWIATHDRSAAELVADTLADLTRLKPGALELDLELTSDPPLRAFVEACYVGIRAKRKSLRMRINLAPWKGFALAAWVFSADPNLYACEQTYAGDMAPYSQADALANLLAYGMPRARATVCYGAAGPVPGSPGRVCTLPDLTRWHRGVIFSDDLMVDAGLL